MISEPAAFADALSHFERRKLLDEDSPPVKVVCVGAHPDDPESGCGGTLTKLAADGHDVQIVYLTRGEAGIKNGIGQNTARLRSSEALAACEVLRASGRFADQIDGQTRADQDSCRQFTELLLGLNPQIVFTHWPFDTHADHRTAAQLTYQAWQWSGESFALVYYEVMTGVQTHHFQPNCFIDISSTWRQKRSAIYAHGSQSPERFYPYHEEIEKRRGVDAGCDRAEAFFVIREKSPKPLLPFTI